MAFIEQPDLISDGALQAPGKLGSELEKVYNALVKILKAAKESESAITASKSTSKVTTETEKLSRAQRDLAKEQDKAAKIAKTLWLSENEVALANKRAADTSKQLGTVTSELDKKMASAANTATAYGKAQKESNAASAQASQIYKAESGSLESLIQKKASLQKSIETQKQRQTELNALLKEGSLTNAQFNKSVTDSNSIISKNGVALQNTNSQIKTHILANTQLGGEYRKLTIQLESARTKYKDLAASGTAASSVLKAQQKVFEDLNKRVLDIDKSVGQFQRNVGNYPKTLTGQLGGLYSAVKLAFTAGLTKEVIESVIELTKLSGQVEGVTRAFERTFPNAVAMLEDLKKSTHGTVTEFDLMQRALKAQNLGVPVKELGKLLEFATVRAQQTGDSVDYLVNSIIDGLGRKSILKLDNLGVSASRLKEAMGGISTQAATVAQVTEAFTKVAGEELQKMGGYAETSATKVEQLTANLSELRVEVAKKVESSWLVDFFNTGIEGLKMLMKGQKEIDKEFTKSQAARQVEAFINEQSFKDQEKNAGAQVALIIEEISERNRLIRLREEEIKQATEKRKNLNIDTVEQQGSYRETVIFMEAQRESLDNQIKSQKESKNILVQSIPILSKYIKQIQDKTKAEKEDTESLEDKLKRQRASLDLEKFRLEQLAKIQEEIVANEKASIDDRIAASVRLEAIRKSIADVDRKKDLLAEKLTSDQKILIEEQTQAKKTEAVKNGNKERNKLNEDEIKKIYDRSLKAVQAEEDASKLLTERLVNEINKRGELEIQAIQERALKGLISKDRAEREILAVQKKYAVEAAEFQINSLEKQLTYESEVYYAERKRLIEQAAKDEIITEAEKILAIQALNAESAEEQAMIAQKIHDLKISLTNNSFSNTEERFAEENAALKQLSSYYDEYASRINQIFANITAQRIMNLQAESDANAKKLQKDLIMAGDNEKAKDQIRLRALKEEEKLEKRRREEQRKGAQREKAFALVSAVIRTASAVLNALSTVQPYPAAVVAAISAGALGALEIANIATAPIPAYEIGTMSAIGGPSLVGEKGIETVIEPSGKQYFTPDVPTVMDIPSRSVVIPNKETLNNLALGALSQNGGSSHNYYIDPALLEEMKQVNSNLKNIKPEPRQSLLASGIVAYRVIENKKGHTKLIRDINLGKWF